MECVYAFFLNLLPIAGLVRFDWLEAARSSHSATRGAHVIHLLDLCIGCPNKFDSCGRCEELAELAI